MRSGVIAQKVGMTRVFTETGEHIPVTVLKLGNCQVLGHRTTDVTGMVSLPEGTEMVMPGDNIAMEVHLIVPIAMEEKLRFAIREGGRTVGAGVVASIVE